MKKYTELTLEQRFALLSFFVIAVLGSLLAIGNYWFSRNQMLNASGGYAEIWVNSIVRYHLQESDFNQKISASRYEELNRFMQNNIQSKDVKCIKIWDLNGRVVYSNEPSIIGKTFKIGEGLHSALKGQVSAEFVPLLENEHQTESGLAARLLEIYAPIFSQDQKIIGAFELYISDRVLITHVNKNRLMTLLLIAFSLILFYFSLIGVFRKASKTIDTQHKRIDTLSSHLDDALSWQEKSYVGIIKALLTALDAKDSYTAGHAIRVTDFSLKIGQSMKLSPERLKLLEEAALFHDIGKIGIPEQVLNKPAKYSEAERIVIQNHSTIGYDIINSIHYFSEHAKIVRHHHEWYDGTGYPDGLKGADIPLEARILAVADTFDALITNRPYKPGLSTELALDILQNEKNTHLDPAIVDLFIKCEDVFFTPGQPFTR